MKKCLLALLMILLFSSAVFAGNETHAVIVSSVSRDIEAPVGLPAIGVVEDNGSGFIIYFEVGGEYEFSKNGEMMEIRLDQTSKGPYKADSIPLDVYYVGNEAAGAYTNITVEVSPWKKIIPDANINNIRASFSMAQGLSKLSAVSSLSDENLNLAIGVLSPTNSNDPLKIGTLHFAWDDKQLGAGDYVATVKISVADNN